MRNHPNLRVQKFKLGGGDHWIGGSYAVPFRQHTLNVIVSDQAAWDHVSVRVAGVKRVPCYEEMEYVRGLFFRDDEYAMQLSVPKSRHISYHDFVLHWWRPQCEKIPTPPAWQVGPDQRVKDVAAALWGEDNAATVIMCNAMLEDAPRLLAAVLMCNDAARNAPPDASAEAWREVGGLLLTVTEAMLLRLGVNDGPKREALRQVVQKWQDHERQELEDEQHDATAGGAETQGLVGVAGPRHEAAPVPPGVGPVDVRQLDAARCGETRG